MKLLFDANLSPKLVSRLADLFPDSLHVFQTGLARMTSDGTIWAYAKSNGLVIVTADSDFVELATARAPGPKVVWLRNCNYRTAEVEALLRRNAIRIAQLANSENMFLVVTP